MQSLS